MKKQNTLKQLADVIEANPNCTFTIDNDCWWITNEDGDEIASSSEFYANENWYNDSNTYGAGIALALITLLNRKGFNLKSTAC